MASINHNGSNSNSLPTSPTLSGLQSPSTLRRVSSSSTSIVDTRIVRIRPLIAPACLIEELPSNNIIQSFIHTQRKIAAEIIHGNSDKLLVVVGPCSIHDINSAIEYAKKLSAVRQNYKNLFITMRVYFEKPRTTVGWKGLINDPTLDGSYQINNGLRVARKLLLDINQLGLPVSCEFLDTIMPQFLCDQITWGAIGARTTESQLHRELVSGLSMPIGFKNGTTGSIKIAVDAIVASNSPHSFLSVTTQGLAAIVETAGNSDCHLVLRGSDNGPNYSPTDINNAVTILNKSAAPAAIMIDCSHGNSSKDHRNQGIVVESVCQQLAEGQSAIIGVMIESNLIAGSQVLKIGQTVPQQLVYGQSITDACVSFDDTLVLLDQLNSAVEQRRQAIRVKQQKINL